MERVDGRFQKVEGTERELPADLVFLAMGFTGAQREGLVDALGVEVDGRGNVARDARVHVHRARASSWPATSGRGQSLIVWAIAEGRAAAAAADAWLTGELRRCPGRSPRRRSRSADRDPPVVRGQAVRSWTLVRALGADARGPIRRDHPH